MIKVVVVACIVAMAGATNLDASPAVDTYIQAIEDLPSPSATIPTAPKGYGAVRDERTGDFLVLVPQDYCSTNAPRLRGTLRVHQTR